MLRRLQVALGIAVVLALLIGPPAAAVRLQKDMRNFRVVREGVLYRSGQMTPSGLRRLVNDYGVRSIVTLRDSNDPRPTSLDLQEDKFCADQEILHLRLPPREWENRNDPAGVAPVEENVRQFLEVMRDPKNHPVLVHCFAGIHRTGAYCALYRIEFEGWPMARALAEMKACGYTALDGEPDIRGYFERYRPGKIGGFAAGLSAKSAGR
jgi:tyrosine-protein phosphatase SIW14